MSIKLEDGKWYLISNDSLGDCAGIYCESDKEFSVCSKLQVPAGAVEIISEMATVKHEEPEYEYVKVSFDELIGGIVKKRFADDYYFRDPAGRDYRARTISIDTLEKNEGSLYRRVKVDKRQKFIDWFHEEYDCDQLGYNDILALAYKKLVK